MRQSRTNLIVGGKVRLGLATPSYYRKGAACKPITYGSDRLSALSLARFSAIARTNRLLTLSRTPQYRGKTYITYRGREIPCLAFDRVGPALIPSVHQSASCATS